MSAMSDRSSRFRRMRHVSQRCEDCISLAFAGKDFCPLHTERWASIEGLIATLGAPMQKRLDGSMVPVGVEIDIGDGVFEQISSLAIDSEHIIIDTLGSAVSPAMTMKRTLLEGVPAWRRL